MDAAEAPTASAMPQPARSTLGNTLFECWRCNRLVETQSFHDRAIVPHFCPWCGKQVSSILGRELDGYRIDEVISRGGFGIVYLASNIAEPTMKAAIKFLRPEMAYSRPELIRIFVEEARLTEAIGQTCWNIVRVSNVREKPWPYYFMEYIRGGTMEGLIESLWPKKIPIEDGRGYLRGIAKVLAATHSRGRIHRDLKPLNVMVIKSQEIVQPEDRIKFLDFGLALKIAGHKGSLEGPSETTGTAPAESEICASPLQTAGTPEYMPPEAFDGINEFSGDIYSFGITAYEILTGERPWKDAPVESQRYSYWRDCHKKKTPRAIRELRPETPKWLARVIMQCLEKNPRNRIPDCETLLRRLRQPVSRWVAAAAAFVACLGCAFAYLTVRPPILEPAMTASVLGWPVAFTTPYTFFVNEVLSGPDLVLRVPIGVEIACSDERLLKVEPLGDGGFKLSLNARDPSLLDRSCTVFGKGKGCSFERVVEFKRDGLPPVVRAVRYRDRAGHVHDFPPGQRLQADGDLLIEVEEENFCEAAFKDLDDGTHSLHSSAGGRKGEPSLIPLRSFPKGSYRGEVTVLDLALNQAKGVSIEFSIDDGSGFELIKDEAIVAANRAFFLFRIDGLDEMPRLSVTQSGCPVPHRVLPGEVEKNRSPATPVELLAQLPDLERKPADPAPSAGRKSCFLGVELPPIAGEFEYALTVVETLLPEEKRNPISIRGRRPPSLEPSRFSRVTLHFDGSPDEQIETKSAASGGVREGRARVDRAPVRISLPNPQELVLAGSWSFSGREQDLSVQRGEISARLPPLLEDRENEIVLKLVDALDTMVSIRLLIFHDTQDPSIERIVAESPGVRIEGKISAPGRLHKSTKGIRLTVEADEPLAGAEITTARSSRPPKKRREPAGRTSSWDLGEMCLSEGRNDLTIRLVDTAGRSTEEKYRVDINLGGPKVSEPKPGELLHVKTNQLEFAIRDGNGIDYKRAKARIETNLGYRQAGHLVKGRGPDIYELTLHDLPSPCDGLLTLEVPDSYDVRRVYHWRFQYECERDWQRDEDVYWKGARWVFVHGKDKDFFMSKTEASIKLFMESGMGDKLGKEAKAMSEEYPATGVAPEVAMEFARRAFGEHFRLPTVEEMRQAAGSIGLDDLQPVLTRAVNCRQSGKPREAEGPLPVDADPFLKTEVKRFAFCRFLHLLGNVEELVLRSDDGKDYCLMGGAFDTPFEQAVSMNPRPYTASELTHEVGLRLVIPVGKAPPDFIAVAKKSATPGSPDRRTR